MAAKSLGEFEQIVLLAVLALGNKSYVVPIMSEILKRTGRKTSHAAVYVALTRLEEKGLVVSHLAEPTAERGGRAKRFFRVLPEAVARLRESQSAMLAMWEGVEEMR